MIFKAAVLVKAELMSPGELKIFGSGLALVLIGLVFIWRDCCFEAMFMFPV